MEHVRRAVWYIEGHFAKPVSLADVASASGMSRFHLSRTFTHVTGRSINSYLRGRRLSEAARTLAQGDADVLGGARRRLRLPRSLHASLSRRLRRHSGIGPEGRSVEHLTLMEPFEMTQQAKSSLPEPSFREEGPFYLAGLREFRAFEDLPGIPGQWQRFMPHLGVPGRVGRSSFGVCIETPASDEGFDYLTAVAVASLDALPEALVGTRLPRRRYAVFPHDDHVSTISATCAAISSEWQPKAAAKPAPGPLMLDEHDDETFDPSKGRGGIEIWIPLAD